MELEVDRKRLQRIRAPKALDLSALAPELSDTAHRVKVFLEIYCERRLFTTDSLVFAEEEKAQDTALVIMSSSPKKLSAAFDLSFIDNVVVKKVGKRNPETADPPVAKSPEPGPSQQRVKSIGKKRKETSMSDPLEGLTVSMAMEKLVSFVDKTSNYVEKMEELMLSKMEDDSKALEDKDKALQENVQTIKELKASFKCERSIWANKQEASNKKHKEEITQIQNSAALVVFEVRLTMARQAAAGGFKSPDWDTKSWEETVVGLGGVLTDSLVEAEVDEQQDDIQVAEGAYEAVVGEGEANVGQDVEGL